MDSADEDGLYVGSIAIYGNDKYSMRPGDDFWVRIELDNRADRALDDLRATIIVPELGLKFRSVLFDLDKGDEDTVSIDGFIPDYAEPGEYWMQIQVSDGDILRSKWRFFDVVEPVI